MKHIGHITEQVVQKSGRLAMDAAFVRHEMERLIEQYPELAEDADLALDMFEGETDLLEIIASAVNERAEAEMMAAAIKERQAALGERKARFERKGEAMKSLIQALMDAAGQEKVTLPEATIFVTKPRESVNVTDLDALPQGYFKLTRTADKTALKAALMAGEAVPGAELQIGLAGLTIRTR